MPDIGKLLWPKTVAVVGASSDTNGLRGRILEVILSHPFAGKVYPVSRSAGEVQGLKAYPSVEALPEPADLAILIIPAQFVPAELERCGRAGIKAAVILSSGFAEEPGEAGHRMQAEITATARRYDMAVSGPNTEGFANIEAALCPTFSPAMDKNAGAIRPARALGKGQVSVISQSGGLGFAFFDRARPRNLAFRHIVTTGNEAALDVADFLDYMLDEGGTDVFLLLLEDVKSPEKFRRAADKALKAGKPLIVGKIGRSEPGSRAVMSHTGALAGSHAAYRAIFQHHGVIEGQDFDDMIDLAAGFLACGEKLPAGRRMGICTSSGGAGVWMADACAAAGLEVPVLDDATRKAIDVHLPSYGTSQNPVDSTAQGVHKLGYAEFARLVGQSPMVDGVIVVVTARRSAFLENDLPKLQSLGRESKKPVFMWTYTLPSSRSVEILNEAGYPLFTGALGCARTMRAMADYRALRERLLRPADASNIAAPDRDAARAMLAASMPVLCEWHARPVLAAYGIGGNEAGQLVHSAAEAEAAIRAMARPAALKVQSADLPHKTEAGAVALAVASDGARAAYERVVAGALAARAARAHRRRAGAADGAARPRSHPRRQPRFRLGPAADGRLGRRAGRGARRRHAGAGAAGSCRGARAHRPPQGRSGARTVSRRTGGRYRGARRPDRAAVAFRRRPRRRDRGDRPQSGHRACQGARRVPRGCPDRQTTASGTAQRRRVARNIAWVRSRISPSRRPATWR